MISYELAKELKDAGFPSEIILETDGESIWNVVKAPTTEELIKTLYLNNKKQLHLKITDTTFVKYKIIDQEGKVVFELNCGGDSLLEALARLWLYLKHDYILINPL